MSSIAPIEPRARVDVQHDRPLHPRVVRVRNALIRRLAATRGWPVPSAAELGEFDDDASLSRIVGKWAQRSGVRIQSIAPLPHVPSRGSAVRGMTISGAGVLLAT